MTIDQNKNTAALGIDFDKWEPIIGLEVHVELNTRSKLFSTAPNQFGDAPNKNICEVCTAQPGALPVLNREAVTKAVRFGCAIGAKVATFSQFDRKSYFYPDSPRNFQITQFYHPIILGGQVEAEVDGQLMSFEVDRAHLEDDAGMLKHCSHFTGVDFNRAGVPLLEIVSKPCIHSGQQAVAYVAMIRAIMQYVDASDCNMEEGSLRVDANISVRRREEEGLRNRVEVKNMNSLTFLAMAIDSEIKRQVRLYERYPDKPSGELIPQGTYRWDEEKKETVMMRRKENSDDYRYFPEPDLVPIILEEKWINEIHQALPELPHAKKTRYMTALGLSRADAAFLASDKALAGYFESGLALCSNPKALCNWMLIEFGGRCREKGIALTSSGIAAENIAKLVHCIDEGKITGKIAKKVADEMMESPDRDCEEIIAANPDYQPLTDESAIETLVDEVLNQEEQSVRDYRQGKKKAMGFLVGQVMKACRGKASPQVVNALLRKKLDNG